MTINALHDKEFLKQLDLCKEKDVYVKIISLDVKEQQVEEIQGTITTGSLNIDGSSAVRRTLSLTISSQDVNINDYYWGFSTKFKVYIGLKNVINDKYDDIIWFNQGMYVITSFSSSYTTTGYTINISGQDKMCLLNGSVGGILPGSIDFKETILYNTIYEPVYFGEQYKKNTYYTASDGAYIISTDTTFDKTKTYYRKNYDYYEAQAITASNYEPNKYYIANDEFKLATIFDEELNLDYYTKKFIEYAVNKDSYKKGQYYTLINGIHQKCYDDFNDNEHYYVERYNRINMTKDLFETGKYYLSNKYIKDVLTTFQEFKQYYKYNEETKTYTEVKLNVNDNSKIKNNEGNKYSPNTYYLDNSYKLATGEFNEYEIYYTLKSPQNYSVSSTLTESQYSSNEYYVYEPTGYSSSPSEDSYQYGTLYFSKSTSDEIDYVPVNIVDKSIQKAVSYIKNKQYYSDADGNKPIDLTAEMFKNGVAQGKVYYVNILDEDHLLYEKNVYYIKDSEYNIYQLATENFDTYNKSTQFYQKKLTSEYTQVIFTDSNNYKAHKYYIYDSSRGKFVLSDDPYSPEKQYYTQVVYQDVNDIPIETIVREAVHFYGQEPYHNIIINDIDDYGLNLMEYRGDEPLYLILKDGNIVDYSMGDEYCYPLSVTEQEFKNYKKIMDGQKNAAKKQYNNKLINQKEYEDLLLEIKNNFLKEVVESDPVKTSEGVLYVPISESEYFIYNNLLEEYNINPTAVMFEGDEDYYSYTIAKIEYGEAVGYQVTPLTYPGELTSSIGDSLVSVLDKIKGQFTSFEYFYDIDGRFVFQKKKDYATSSWNNIITRDNEIFVDNTKMRTSSSYDFVNNELVISVSNSPKFDSVKNDFSIWGTRKGVNDVEIPIYGRMALDKKPEQYVAFPFTKSKYQLNEDGTMSSSKKVLVVENVKTIPFIVQYRYFSLESQQYKDYQEKLIDYQKKFDLYQKYGESSGVIDIEEVKIALKTSPNAYELKPIYYQGTMYGGVHYIDCYCDWREIIYQMAKDYYQYSQTDDYLVKLKEFNPTTCANRETGYERYYSEMISFWRDIYDTDPSIEYEYDGGYYTTYPDYDITEGLVTREGWKEYAPDKSQMVCDFYLPEVYYDEYYTDAEKSVVNIEDILTKLSNGINIIESNIEDELKEINKLIKDRDEWIAKKSEIYAKKGASENRQAIADELAEAYKAYSEIYAKQQSALLELYDNTTSSLILQNLT